MNNEVLKNLLKEDRKTLKALNEVFHIDFNKPVQAVHIKGNTTIKQILKQINCDNRTMILVLNKQLKSCWKDSYFIGMINDKEKVFIDLPKHYFNCNKLHTYYSVGDFRDDLKNKDEGNEHYIIAVQYDDLVEEKKKSIDTTERHRFIDSHYYGYSNKPGRYINNITLADATGKPIDYGTISSRAYCNGEYTEIDQIIDKSGYIVCEKRIDLIRKADEVRREKAKNAYLASDNTEKVQELSIRIKAKKLELLELFKAADSAKAIEEVGKMIGEYSWKGLSEIMHEYEKMLTGIQEKSYSSIADFNRHYELISNKLLNLGKEK